MVTATRFECSEEARKTWRTLYNLWPHLRGDVQFHRNTYEPIGGYQSDLATNARCIAWGAESKLMLLEVRGPGQKAGVALSKARLNRQRVTDVVRRYELDYCRYSDDQCRGCQAHELMFKVREWLHWALDVDEEIPEPEPWAI